MSEIVEVRQPPRIVFGERGKSKLQFGLSEKYADALRSLEPEMCVRVVDGDEVILNTTAGFILENSYPL